MAPVSPQVRSPSPDAAGSSKERTMTNLVRQCYRLLVYASCWLRRSPGQPRVGQMVERQGRRRRREGGSMFAGASFRGPLKVRTWAPRRATGLMIGLFLLSWGLLAAPGAQAI